MRTLVVDALRLTERPTGPGRYVQFLVQQWSRMEVPFDRIVVASPRPPYLLPLGETARIELRSFGGGWPNLGWEQVALPRAIGGAALLFCPAYTCPLACPGRVVVANHGIYEGLRGEFSGWTRLRTTPLHRRRARRADRVIANSRSTRADLVRHFGVPEAKIDVVYPAAGEPFFQTRSAEEVAQEVAAIFGERVPYVLFVGKLSRRRNVPNLIEAFARACGDGAARHRLLIVGPNTSGVPLREIAERARIPHLVRHVPYLEQEPLARLYAGADLFVLPTTHEGISHTMFEAMASGTPVLTVRHPTLEEGAGDAAFAVPTASVEDLARALGLLLADPALRRRHAERGRARAARFSWRESARATMEILDRVAFACDRRWRPGAPRPGRDRTAGAGRTA